MKNKFAFWKIFLRGNQAFASRRVFALCVLTVCAAIATDAFAMPGFKPYIADRFGEYVYYRDYTFQRESYVGFLAYDESTYAVRYYAPADISNGLFEENILLYFSVNPDLPYMHMTGERIATPITPEQTDIVNYLHDLLYDFDAKRINAGDVTPETAPLFDKTSYNDAGLSIAQDYPSFGGRVHILFDYLVPIFNIKKIVSNDNKVVFEIVTIGMLRSSEDNSFTSFSGMSPTNAKKTSTWQPDVKATKITHTVNNQQVTLDSSWTNPMENLWLLGDEALLSLTSGSANISQLLRMMLQNANWQNISLSKKNNMYTLSSVYHQPDSDATMRSFRVITERDSTCTIFMLTIFNNTYESNRSYFDGILKSYSVK